MEMVLAESAGQNRRKSGRRTKPAQRARISTRTMITRTIIIITMAVLMARHYSEPHSQIITAISRGMCVRGGLSRLLKTAGGWEGSKGRGTTAPCPMSTGHVKTHLPLTSSHCAYKRIIYKSLTFKNCQLQGKCCRFDVQFMELTLKCSPVIRVR